MWQNCVQWIKEESPDKKEEAEESFFIKVNETVPQNGVDIYNSKIYMVMTISKLIFL